MGWLPAIEHWSAAGTWGSNKNVYFVAAIMWPVFSQILTMDTSNLATWKMVQWHDLTNFTAQQYLGYEKNNQRRIKPMIHSQGIAIVSLVSFFHQKINCLMIWLQGKLFQVYLLFNSFPLFRDDPQNSIKMKLCCKFNESLREYRSYLWKFTTLGYNNVD